MLFLMARQFGSDEQSKLEELLINMKKDRPHLEGRGAGNAVISSGRIPNKSYPKDVAVFTGQNPGNFEPSASVKVLKGPSSSGPAENGKAHKLRVEQKNQEEKPFEPEIQHYYFFLSQVCASIFIKTPIKAHCYIFFRN